jgi:hypothetical protein
MARPRSCAHPTLIVRQSDETVDVRAWARQYVRTLLAQERAGPNGGGNKTHVKSLGDLPEAS